MTAIILMLLFIAIVGFLVWLITENISMPPAFKQTIIMVSVVLLVLWVLAVLTGNAPMPSLPNFG